MDSRAEKRGLIVGAGALAVIVAIGVGLQQGCQTAAQPPDYLKLAESMCGNRVLDEHPSPDRRRRVVVFQRDCGATTGVSTQASIVPAGADLPNVSGNVFVASTNRGAAPAGKGGGPEVRVRWASGARVVLSHHPAAHVFKAERGHDGIDVVVEVFR
jgi:hypothetical protein